MKWIFGTNNNLLARSFAAVVMALASLAAIAAASDEMVQTKGDISYVSGGVGEESLARLGAREGDFNLKLVFALKSGAYLSGVKVAIADATGKALLEATSKGPWFLARLPAGNYRIVASLADKALTRQVTIGETRQESVDFRWASE